MSYSAFFNFISKPFSLSELIFRFRVNIPLLNFFLFLNLNNKLHGSAGKIKNQITKIQVNNPGEIIPIKRLRIVHE
jgi:hypothetical protein